MCGLGGVAAIGAGTVPMGTEQALRRMLATLAHRGPDDEKIRIAGPVGMAFTRLSLVDVAGGNQPLTSQDAAVTLIANGEIYNHTELEATLPGFRPATRSDCEVLIGLYQEHGLRFLDGVRGIFALALHDVKNNQLVLATDPFATKPMYYHRTGTEVVFGSEIKALFDWPTTPRQLDWLGSLSDQAMSNRTALETGPVNTWFDGIQRVEGGTIVTIALDTGHTAVHRYWQLAEPLSDGDAPSVAEYVQRYREVLLSSVADSLMAEVEIGLFLSGGIDSAVIAAIAREYGQPLHTFTAATESTVLNGDVDNARLVASLLGVSNTVAAFDSAAVPSAQDWKHLLWLLETPLTGAEQYYKYSLYRVAKQARPGIKAMLLGAGADEFNGGYSSMLAMGGNWEDFERNVRRLDVPPMAAASPLGTWLAGELPPMMRADAVGELGMATGPVDTYRNFLLWKWREVQQYNCWHEDRTAAGNGVEARVPFLDRRLVDLATSVPLSMRKALLWDKGMARAAADTLLPEAIRLREKKPFFHGPAARYAHAMLIQLLEQDDRALVHEALATTGAKEYLDPTGVHAALDALSHGNNTHQVDLVLRLVNLGLLELAAHTPQAPFGPEQVSLRAETLDGSDPALLPALFVNSVSEHTVLRYGPSCLLLHDPHGESWHLSFDGVLEYEIDGRTDPGWLRFLQGIDGRRTLPELLRLADVELDAIAEFLTLCLESGLLVAQSPAAEQPTSSVVHP